MEQTTQLLPTAHRVIRAVDVGESAFAGVLVSDDAVVRVRVDATSVAPELWRYGAAEHIAGVRDVIRRADGHDALLPWCAERMTAFLGRRQAAEASLTPGEVVTLVGSLLRAIAEAGSEPLMGVWWLADDARPVFVPGDGDALISAARTVISQVRALTGDRALDRLLTDIERMPDDHRVVRKRLDGWEAALTEHAAPRALQREVFAPERVSGIAAHRMHLAESIDADAPRGTSKRVALGHWAADARDRVRGAVSTVRRMLPRRPQLLPGRPQMAADDPHGRVEPPTSSRQRPSPVAQNVRKPRRRMVLVAAAAGAVVLGVGLFWPQGDAPSQADDVQTPVAVSEAAQAEPNAASEPALSEPAPSEPAPPASGDSKEPTDTAQKPAEPPTDAASAARVLLPALAACREASDTECVTAVSPGGGEKVLSALMKDVTDAEVEPVEDYGDVAVVSIDAAGGRQMLVLIRINDSWLVRDVYDVADQP